MGNEPGRLLIDHLKGVYYLMMSEIETAKKYMDFERFLGVEYSTLKLLVEAIAYLHDLGKATPEFQKKIRKLKYDKEKSLHAVLGAFAVGKYLKANLPEEKHYLIPLIVTLVRRHHGKAEYPEFGCDLNDEVDLLEWQVANLDSKFLNELAYKIQIPKLDPLELEDNVDEWQDEFQDHSTKLMTFSLSFFTCIFHPCLIGQTKQMQRSGIDHYQKGIQFPKTLLKSIEKSWVLTILEEIQ